MSIAEVTLGTDPEFFVETPDGVLPAFFALGGDVDVTLPFGTAYCDGAAVEMTVDHSGDVATLTSRLGANIAALQAHLDTALSVRSNGYVAPWFIDQLPEQVGKRASLQVLGCDRDMRVYPWAEEIERPDPKTYPWRTVGGHIHIGIGQEAIQNLALVNFTVAFCDLLIGTAGTYLCDEQESRDRKRLYGKAGTIRLKAYGAIEYRPLPAKALVSTSDLAFHMFSLAQKIGWFTRSAFAAMGVEGLLDLAGGYEAILAASTAIDIHDVAQCRAIQQAVAQRLDALPESPHVGMHVAALQQLCLPPSFQVRW